MTIYNKPSDLPAWAESGDKVQPSDAEIQTGWPLSTVPPSRQRFNWLLNWLATGVRYFMQRGVPEWDLTEEYPAGARVQYNDVTYVSLSGTSNIGEQPDTATTFWERWGYSESELSAFNDAYLSKSVAGGVAVTLTAAEARKAIFNFTGVLTANINVIIPAAAKRFIVRNNTSGAFTLTVKTSGGTGVAVLQGSNTALYCDGTNTDYAAKSGETAAQFDNDTSLTTAAFVQRALGNFSNGAAYTSAITLTALQAGRALIFGGASPYTVTLPLLSEVPDGAAYYLTSHTNLAAVTIQRQGADDISMASQSVTSFILNNGDSAILTKAAGSWRLISGSAQLPYSSIFGASLAASGYQKLPSGLIVQWGATNTDGSGLATFTHPVAFPTASLRNVAQSGNGTARSAEMTSMYQSSLTQTSAYVSNAAGAAVSGRGVVFVCIGY